jgi:uncharacterized membrane protein (UPF0136 family)
MVYFAFIYGILTIVGGVIGYLKAGSMMSLYSGVISGILILVSAFALLKGKPMGFYGLVGLSGILTVFFGIRFFKAFVFMPAGLMLILSLITLVGLLLKRPTLIQGS